MDEPLSHLDSSTREQLQVELKKLQQRLEITILYVTHNMEEAVQLAYRISMLENGQVLTPFADTKSGSNLPFEFRNNTNQFLEEFEMDISKTIAELKKDKAFVENVGMVLVHNGTVRGWSRGDHADITQMEVVSDQQKIEAIRQEIEQMPGIYKIVIEAHSGVMNPGDDILFLVVAGDIRENVKPALAILLDRVKSEAVSKKEYLVEESQ